MAVSGQTLTTFPYALPHPLIPQCPLILFSLSLTNQHYRAPSLIIPNTSGGASSHIVLLNLLPDFFKKYLVLLWDVC